jgi:hypothetical protein
MADVIEFPRDATAARRLAAQAIRAFCDEQYGKMGEGLGYQKNEPAEAGSLIEWTDVSGLGDQQTRRKLDAVC